MALIWMDVTEWFAKQEKEKDALRGKKYYSLDKDPAEFKGNKKIYNKVYAIEGKERYCVICENEIIFKPKKYKTCSRECEFKLKTEQADKVECPVCGKMFAQYPHNKILCSDACSLIRQRKINKINKIKKRSVAMA